MLEGTEDGALVRQVVTVLNDTEIVDGVETRVVEERETEDGDLVEVSRNFFAICQENNSVSYFGEHVDIIENGVVVDHDGSWRSGVSGARFGLAMPGIALLGARSFQEIAPGVALDRAEIIALDAVATTPAGRFTGCLRTRETNALHPGKKEFKIYAPGIGVGVDETISLIEFGFL